MKRQIGLAMAIPGFGIILIGLFLYVHDRAQAPSNESVQAYPTSSITSMLITSPSFKNNEFIPDKFTCAGGDINPELDISNVPPEAKGLALIMDDPDAPGGTFTHWTIWNIDPKTTVIKEESIPPGSTEGTTGFGQVGYGGPCPPQGKPHHYNFTFYAINSLLDLPAGSSRDDLEKEIGQHLIEKVVFTGLYQKK